MSSRFLVAALLLVAGSAAAQQRIDSAYTAQIRELTPTDPVWKFTTELVDYLPASATVPTPLAVLGYVPGTIGRLSYVADVNRYFKSVADASPRAQLFSLGMSDEGREMLLLAIADETTIGRLDEYRAMLARLADPRGLAAEERDGLIRSAKPVYWLTGSIHSPETGSPEMLMELAYRLAVDESEHVRAIRDGVITLITPVLEVDGRDRIVDTYRLAKSLHLPSRGVSLAYWGKYTAHDNNRDGMVLSQRLTQNYIRAFLEWKPVIGHDLHESVPFLYTSTGTGPYNDEFDAIVVDEWHQLAYQEINELTRRGLPGVWTHGFYDGWAPNYVLAIANLHNSVGRFYETYTSSGADCHTVDLRSTQTDREWYRPNPPVNGVRWCIRTNINYQQSGVLIALRYVADHRTTFLENYAAKAERIVRRGTTTAPYAYVVPRHQRHAAEAADLVNLFRAHGTEVHVASEAFTLSSGSSRPGAGSVEVAPGDWIVRMDQPYTQTVRTVLAIQQYGADDPRPYDDTGWTLDALRHVKTVQVADSSILRHPMTPLTEDARVAGSVSGSGSVYLVPHLGDWRSAVLPWKVGTARVTVADSAFTAGEHEYPAGTFVVTEQRGAAVRDAIVALGLEAVAVGSAPEVPQHAIALPRIALMHTWRSTQDEGWVRFAFDTFRIPYTYISDQDLRTRGTLDQIDVVVFPHTRGFGGSLLNGMPMVGPPVPWKRSNLTPNLGAIDETDDMRPGMGLEGAAALRRFVERGGLLLVEGATVSLPVDLGFTPTVSIAEARSLNTRGAVFRAQTVTTASPILYGYDQATFPVYFNAQPLLTVQARDTSVSARERDAAMDTAVVAEMERMRAKVILRFHQRQDSLLVSGLMEGTGLARRAAVVDAPLGRGHVVSFAIRPFWRWQTQGSFAMAFNAIANWNRLGN
ncbi:MAG TPA: M14 family zinc carboxypeptidase [Gemmatimonadales bacterium]